MVSVILGVIILYVQIISVYFLADITVAAVFS